MASSHRYRKGPHIPAIGLRVGNRNTGYRNILAICGQVFTGSSKGLEFPSLPSVRRDPLLPEVPSVSRLESEGP
jgi:hypothetical protein